MPTLFVKPFDEQVYEDLRAVSRVAGLSIAKTSEAIIANVLGLDHPFAEQVKRAIKSRRAKI